MSLDPIYWSMLVEFGGKMETRWHQKVIKNEAVLERLFLKTNLKQQKSNTLGSRRGQTWEVDSFWNRLQTEVEDGVNICIDVWIFFSSKSR